jgi:hypothetical protein
MKHCSPFGWLLVCIGMTLMVALLVLGSGCTITPVKVHSAQASFDGLHQDSGFLGFAPNGSGYISEETKARYNALVQTFARRFTVALQENEGIDPTPIEIAGRKAWLMDPEHLVKFQTMTRWRKEKSEN